MRVSRLLLAALVALASLAGCTRSAPRAGAEVLVVLSVPVSKAPWIGQSVVRGAKLAAEAINADGGIEAGGRRRRIRLDVLDHGNSVAQALANARSAVQRGAAILVTDGVGAVAVAGVTGPARLPTFVTFDGGEDILDEKERPTLFRMAPANRPMTYRLSDYLADRKPKVALLTDDSGYGRAGRADVTTALRRNRSTLTVAVEVPASAADPAPQVLRAQQSGADHLVVWARAPVVAAVLRAVRSRGWDVPVYAGPTAEDPLVRQQLADHPEWVDGLTFVSFRITSEVGPEPFATFRAAYEAEYGREEIGVRAGGRPVVQPPDWAMYPYDALYLLRAALALSQGALGQPLLDAFHQASITGANGDERNFLPANHEGVSPDDMYFATFSGMRFAPVRDDPLSAGLPAVPQ